MYEFKFKIYFTVDGVEDFVIVEADSLQEVYDKTHLKMVVGKGLDIVENNIRSEEVRK